MKFSERLGFKPVREHLQVDFVDEDLKNSLWSVCYDTFLKPNSNSTFSRLLGDYAKKLYSDFFKKPIDKEQFMYNMGASPRPLIEKLREYYFDKGNWFDYYDFIEFTGTFANQEYHKAMNTILAREGSAYRFINGQLSPITNEIEIVSIEDSINSNSQLNSVSTHLNTALSLLSDKENPDYRNSIKESISAVEAMCKIVTGDKKATLGGTLKELEKSNVIHTALKGAFSSLYGYTSDDGGIRHALTEGDRAIDFHEAKFMLVTCSAFINYLKGRQFNNF